jgi:predicted RNase H-like nuclease (RuvC/YqgF family)
LPFEDQIVYDGWIGVKNIIFGGSLSTDIGDEYEEAKHRFGIIDSLPVPEEDEKTDAEELRFYMKNKRNRERYASEIEQLREKTNELERIYHQEMGKARARSLGRELRELELNEAYVAIYDDRIITSAPSESEVRKLLEEIMPAGKTDHPYIYHFDP